MVIRKLILALVLMTCAHGHSLAEIVVVVDARSGVDQLTHDEVVNIFLGRYRRLPTGIAAVPIDQPAAGDLRAQFYRKLVNKSLSEINAYWSRLYFSGKTTPPVQTRQPAEVLARIADTPGGIAYIDRSQVDARVKVVLALSP